jgi:hypothetical protein
VHLEDVGCRRRLRRRREIGQDACVSPGERTAERPERNRRVGRVGQHRLLVLVCAMVTTIAKLRLAGTTEGTNDIGHWRFFASSVHDLGAIGIYSSRFPVPFNHPPLISWWLAGVNAVSAHGLSLRFLIRVPASVADIATALIVFELIRHRRSLNEAAVAGVVVAFTPVLFVISGFHGNTDPVFVMFALLSAYLVVRDRPFGAGVSAAIALSIKLVPVVALPVIAAALLRDRRRLRAATIGFLAVLVPLWGPVVALQWSGFKRNVLDYEGLHPQESRWGIVDFARHTHLPGFVDFLVGPGRGFALAIAAFVPAYLVLRRRGGVAAGVGLSLALFLLLTTNFGMQYLAWAAASVLLLDVWVGTAFNVSAGVLVIVTYTHWTNGFPWDQALAQQLTASQERLGWLSWTVLLVCVVLGVRRLWTLEPTLAEAEQTSLGALECGSSAAFEFSTSTPAPADRRRSGLCDADEVARRVAERAVARSPRLRDRLLEHLRARRSDLLEGGVEVVGAEDRGPERALRDECEQGVALGLRTTAVRLRQHDADLLSGSADGDPAEAVGRDVVADLEAERVPIEDERGVGVVDGDEHGGNGDCHATTVRVAVWRALLRSCSVPSRIACPIRPWRAYAAVGSRPCSRTAERPRDGCGRVRGISTASHRRSR